MAKKEKVKVQYEHQLVLLRNGRQYHEPMLNKYGEEGWAAAGCWDTGDGICYVMVRAWR